MRLLVLGSGGALGKVLQACWPENNTPTWHTRSGGHYAFDILREPEMLANTVANHDVVLILAGTTKADERRPFSTNIALAKAVLDASQNKPVLLASSAAVYGDQSGLLSERSILKPVSPYGRSKVEMEQLAQNYPKACCLRIGNVAGADALLSNTAHQHELHQFADGTYPIRSYIGPHQLALTCTALACLALSEALPACVNLACPDPAALNDLLRFAGLGWRATPAPDTAIRTVHLDSTVLQSLVPVSGGAADIVADWQRMEAAR